MAQKRRGDQKKIALRLDVDESTVTRFLQGKLEPPFEAVRVMAEVIGLDLSEAQERLGLPEDLAERIKNAVAEAIAEYGSPNGPPKPKSGPHSSFKHSPPKGRATGGRAS